MFKLLSFSALLAVSVLAPALAAPVIGSAVWVKNEAFLQDGDEKKPLEMGAPIHGGETILTGDGAIAEVELLDKTKLAMAPSARVSLEDFTFNARTSKGHSIIEITEGAYRIMTGGGPNVSHEIKTPAASLSVRGAVFDIYAGKGGGTALVVHSGKIEVCNLAGSCTVYGEARQVVVVSAGGNFSVHSGWDEAFMPAVNASAAFPFLGQRLFIDPVPRWSLAALSALPPDAPAERSLDGRDFVKTAHLKAVHGEVQVNGGQGFHSAAEGADLHPGDRVWGANGSAIIVYWNGITVPVGNGEAVLVLGDPPAALPPFADGGEIIVAAGGLAAGSLAAIVILETQKSHGASP